jgi:hypothetical protein
LNNPHTHVYELSSFPTTFEKLKEFLPLSPVVETSRDADDVTFTEPIAVGDSLTRIPSKRTSSESTTHTDILPSSKRPKMNTVADKENICEASSADKGKTRAVSGHRPEPSLPLLSAADGELCRSVQLDNDPEVLAGILNPDQSHRSIQEFFMAYITSSQDITTLRTMK